MKQRKAKTERVTSEVRVKVDINLDGKGVYEIETGIPFFNHMLSQFAKHGYFDLKISASGDLDVDFHHTVEDVGLALGDAFQKALGDKKSIRRFGEAFVPFDETLAFASVDLSGRPYLVYRVKVPKSKVGEFDLELGEEFFKSFSNTLLCNLHIELKYGENLHHMIEAIFKAVGRALDKATRIDPRSGGIPSTKGKL
ncbi:MAG: imidazoleglycerol-phosphate dehydratase [Candidatus Dadabacteria bacterium RIFCSPHIGHO2_12_FULL_53_21]|nr:MAG: imidazoleglycerol-phosphate dehydratase [Candidatus Dadabacteria bacterium RIFCSPHIGHO2_12_FULL_53_21]